MAHSPIYYAGATPPPPPPATPPTFRPSAFHTPSGSPISSYTASHQHSPHTPPSPHIIHHHTRLDQRQDQRHDGLQHHYYNSPHDGRQAPIADTDPVHGRHRRQSRQKVRSASFPPPPPPSSPPSSWSAPPPTSAHANARARARARTPLSKLSAALTHRPRDEASPLHALHDRLVRLAHNDDSVRIARAISRELHRQLGRTLSHRRRMALRREFSDVMRRLSGRGRRDSPAKRLVRVALDSAR